LDGESGLSGPILILFDLGFSHCSNFSL
jgi:hypothetical protein